MGGFSGGGINALNSNSTVTDGGSGTGFITISQVIEDPNTSGTFDIIGDGTNAMGSACVASTGTNPAPNPSASPIAASGDIQGSGASTCECQFTYNDPTSGNASESVQVDTSYHEANMVQCSYGGSIPSGATTVAVALVSSTGGGSSNSITINLSTITNGVNPIDPNSFYQVNRYQCRDSVTIMSMFNQGDTTNAIYDPIQSEDPTISYPLNFYTTNFGGAYSLYASSNIQSWNCPALPNDPSVPGLDLRVFSQAADSAGSVNIYPPSGSAFDRSTFYVAKQATGVFNVALNTYVAPQLYGNGGGANAVGYGATPSSTGVQGQESCPDSSVAIPPGYQWAKLWLFRAALNARRYIASAPISSVTVSCNPGFFPGAGTPQTPVFPDCNTGGTGGVSWINASAMPAAPNILADRALGGESATINVSGTVSSVNMCVEMSGLSCASGSNSGAGCSTQASGTAQEGFPFNEYGLGTDVWEPKHGEIVFTPVKNYVNPVDPLNLFSDSFEVPKDLAPTLQPLATDEAASRYDFLFVVTPPSVMSGDMSTGAGDIQQYIPYRFPAKESCPFANPASCTGAIQYGYHNQDISAAGNTTGTTIVYPMCVLQPITP